MTDERRDPIRIGSAVVTAFSSVVLLPIAGWSLVHLVDQGERIARIETWMGEGRRYSQEDAVRDLGVITKVIARQGLELDDHETRIRKLERSQN